MLSDLPTLDFKAQVEPVLSQEFAFDIAFNCS